MTITASKGRKVGILAGVGLATASLGAFPFAPPAGAATLGSTIANDAVNELNNSSRNTEQGGYNCNYYSTFFSRGSASCSNGWKSEEWCADFAEYVWKEAGANISGLNAGAISFYNYGVDNGTWHPGTAGIAQGDVAVYGVSGGYASHVAIVTAIDNGTVYTVGGNSGPNTNEIYKTTVGSPSGYTVPLS